MANPKLANLRFELIRASFVRLVCATCTVCLFVVLAFSLGCETQNTSNAGKQKNTNTGPLVMATSVPLQQIARAILDDSIAVEVPFGDAKDPRTWQPTADAVSRMQKADLVLTGGPALPYAEWINKISLPDSRIYQCGKAMKLSEFIHIEDYQIVHQHGPEGEHSHPLMIPHFWLHPRLTAQVVSHLAKRLESTYPDQAESIRRRAQELARDLNAEQTKLESLAADSEGDAWLFTNPNFSFLAKAMGVKNRYLIWLEDKPEESKKRQLELAQQLEQNPQTMVVTTSGFAQALVQSGKRPETRIITLDLMESASDGDSILERLQAQTRAIQSVLDETESVDKTEQDKK